MNTIQKYYDVSNLVMDYLFDPSDLTQKSNRAISEPSILFPFLPKSIQALSIQIFGEINTCPSELVPYRIIRFLASRHCEVFYETALINLDQDLDRGGANYFLTACIHTICATTPIFLGEKANKVLKGLQWDTTLPAVLPYSTHIGSQSSQTILLKDPFPENTPEEEIDDLLANINLYVSHFNFREDCSARSYIGFIENYFLGDDIFLGDSYIDQRDFNAKTIASLKSQILTNQPSFSKSFIYTIIIFSSNGSIHHIFQINHFYSSTEEESLFRVITSWGKTHTLMENFSKQGFDEGIAGCMDIAKMKEFIVNFEKTYSLRNLKKNRYTTESCFGYDFAVPRPLHRSSEQYQSKIVPNLTFATIRFQVSELKPLDALFNAALLIESSEAFKKALNLEI